jgi:hypothetical protein
MFNLNESLLIKTAIPSLSIILGVILSNGFEQANLSNNYTKILATIAFVGGWILLPFALSLDRSNKWMYFVMSYSIVFSASALKYFMINKKQPPFFLAILFMVAWPLLGYFIATPLGGTPYSKKSLIGLFAGGCAVLSMVVVLPFERKKLVTDGIGMSLFTLAWTLVTILNSSR